MLKEHLKKKYYYEKVDDTAESVGANLSVNGPSRVTERTSLGDNVNFNGLRIRGGGTVRIGDNFHSGPECLILTRNHNFDRGDKIPYDSTYNYKKVEINDNVWLGARVTIIPGVTIGEGAIIQAGSTVTQDIPKGAIAGGHPAEVFTHRDMAHYQRLKEAGKFH
ncbi:acyltransferase [Halorubraceae archaeon YAN]|nr:acyltransferase [Halorubraceae archaeon YAN]